MKRLTNFIFSRRKLVIFLFVLVLGFGVYSYIVIPKQEMPEIDTPYMTLTITVPGVNATEIETDIVKDIETTVLTFSDVMEVRTFIFDNYAISYILFRYSSVDPDQTTIDIYNKIIDLNLSDDIADIRYDSGFDDPHIIFSVSSETLSQTKLHRYARTFQKELLLMNEVQQVTLHDPTSEEVVITCDTELLSLYGLSIQDIYNILYANAINIPLGGLQTTEGIITIDGTRTFDELSDISNLIILPENPGVSPEVTLSDLATITIQNTSEKEYLFNSQNTIFLSVFFNEDIDFTKMGNEVVLVKESVINQIDDEEVHIDELLFLPDYVRTQISSVFYSLLSAIGVVMIIVLIGIGFRNSLLIVSTIPVIIFGTIGVLYLADYELHKLTIVGLIIAIGILVDNSIVITEGIKRNIDQGYSKTEGAKKAIIDNFAPVLSSTLTTIAAFIVLVLLPGFLGEIVSSMPFTVIITITLSYIVSMVLSPVLAIVFLKQGKQKHQKSIHEKRIKKMISATIKYPFIWVLVSIGGLVVVVYYAFTTQPLDLYPNDERSVLYIDFENQVLGDLESTKTLHDNIVQEFYNDPQVLHYGSSIGGDLPHFHFSAELISDLSHFGRIYLALDMNEKELFEYIEILEERFEKIDTAKITVNLLELSPPIAPVRLTVSGDNIATVDVVSTQIFDEIRFLDEVKTYNIVQNQKAMKYKLEYNQEQMSSSFITKAEIDETITRNLNGYDLEMYEYNDETINVNVNTDISSITALLSVPITSSVLETSYPLNTFITASEIEDYGVIYRLNNQNVSYIDLYFTDDSSVKELENAVKNKVSLFDTTDVTISYGGENELFTEISSDLIMASIIAIVFILIIMMVQFNSFVKPLIIFLTIPLSFTGSFLFLLLFDEAITATALVGMVSLLGVTVNTGILLVEYITREYEQGKDVRTACTEAVYLRFRPIMLTSATTILGLIPLYITGGNFFRPLAVTFMGGMITSTLITLFLIPSVYALLYQKKKRAERI